MKNIIIWSVIVIILAVGGFYFVKNFSDNANVTVDTEGEQNTNATTTIEQNKTETVIGKSVESRDMIAYHFGTGSKEILFVGGVHGGYGWNTALVAYELMDYLKADPTIIPSNIKVTVIPVVNPDGLSKVVGTTTGNFSASDVSSSQTTVVSGRFNANNVDLNRNFDCRWQATSTWQSKIVSAGTKAFSEPESLAIKNFVLKNNPSAVIFWHSKSNAVYASECEEGILPETLNIMDAYSNASGYPAIKSFDAYVITGDAEGWLASINIPAITVELKTHDTVEWSQNLAGIKAIFEYYGDKN